MKQQEVFPFNLTEAEWRTRLTPEQYRVMRDHGTEPSSCSPLNKEYGDGIYQCVGCDQPLFDSQTKFDSGTGWPSFFQPLPGAVSTTTDFKIGYPRTEVHCANCGSHLGHVFADSPKPTNQRYCMNGVALKFKGRSQ